jgi:predicted NAD/FAD-binding protein
VVGSGIAGLGAAYALTARGFGVTLFETSATLGGHTNTVDVTLDGATAPVDTGFLVYNEGNYPLLAALFDELGVATCASEMSFAVRNDVDDVEWAGSGLSTLFAQRGNVGRPAFWRMLADIARFNREATSLLAARDELTDEPLGRFLERRRYSRPFRDWYLLPMAAAIWSCPRNEIANFPIGSFARFCATHGLLQWSGRPQWRTVVGGGREYVRRIALRIGEVRPGCRVESIHRDAGRVTLRYRSGAVPRADCFDHVVLACHADDARRLLPDAALAERAALANIRFAPNRAVLHTDPALMPRRRTLWSSWNHLLVADDAGRAPVAVSYWLNRLQPVPFATDLFLTLNPPFEPQRARVLAEFTYDHPIQDAGLTAARQRLEALQGTARTWYCGAWMGYGFHEDGLASGYAVARAIRAAVAPERAAAARPVAPELAGA